MGALKARVGLVQFPGSNCDQDCIEALRRHFGIEVSVIWHSETSLPKIDGLIIPGGFSYGDYLRSGALAAHSPVMREIRGFAAKGGPIIGICNGFQILTETKLLPGVLLRNFTRKFICKYTALKASEGRSAYHKSLGQGVSRLPVAHGQGRYYCDAETLHSLRDNGQIVMRYSAVDGTVSDAFNLNGSLDAIAGIVSENGKIFGLMPHPERATDTLVGGSEDGLKYFNAFLEQCS